MKKQLLTLLTLLLAICSGAWADNVVGYTEAINGTKLDARVLASGDEHVTISGPSNGSNITDYKGTSKSVIIDGKTYTNTDSWRKSQKDTYNGQDVGYTLTVASGYKMNISHVSARIAVADDTYKWYVEILNGAGTQIWKSGEKESKETGTSGVVDADVTSKTDVQGLSGNVTVKLWVKQGGSTKYYSINYLQLTVATEADSRPTYVMNVSSNDATMGTVSPENGSAVTEGEDVAFTATPASDAYKFVKWTIDGTDYTENPYTLTNVTATHTAVATFAKRYTVSYALGEYAGTIGKVLNNVNRSNGYDEKYSNDEEKYTIPSYAHKYLYREGYVFDKWVDGDNNQYSSGDIIAMTKDITLTPTWKATTQSLNEANAATTVTWPFAKAQILFTDWQSNDKFGYHTQNVEVNGETIAVPMSITKGKVSNWGRSDAIAQTNASTVFTIPAVKGMIVTIADAYVNFSTTTIAGSTEYEGSGTKTISFTYEGTEPTIDIVLGENNQYLNTIAVTYPMAESRQASDLTITSPTEVELDANTTTAQIAATTSATVALTYTSSNTTVATVSETGLITAVANGTATITVAQEGDAVYKDDSKIITVTVNNGVTPSYTVDAILNNETGSKLESGEQTQGQAYSFGINLNNERVTADAADAVVVISGTYHNDHGSVNVTATVKATGNMKFTLGNCTYNNGNATLKNASNETLKTVDLSGTGCWKGTHTDVTTFYYEGAAQTLTLSVSSYIPYIKVESVGELPKNTVTFKNGEETVETKQIMKGEGLGTLPTPTYDSSSKYFVGWFSNTSDPGTKALASTVPTSNTTYYAVFIDAPTTTAGYYTPQNGVELYGLVSYLNSSNLSSAKIFLKNGTYDWGTAAETQLTKSNVSIIGESMDGTILTTVPTQEGLGTATLLYNKGQYNYLQDLTLHNNYLFGNTTGRAASLKDEGNYTICNNVWLYSHQDTYYSHSTGAYFYFKSGKISGCVDYMCGQSRVYYDGVTLSNDNRGSTMTANSELYVFNNCVIENAGQTYNFGRAWSSISSGYPVCVFLNTTLKDNGSKLASTRWTLDGLNTDYVIAGEYGTKNASGTDITPASNNVTFKKNNTQMNTILTAEQAATYTMEYTLGDWATTAASDVEQATVTDVKLAGNTLSWTGTSDAYLIEKNGEFVALTTDASYDVSAAGLGTYTVRAANSRGGFGEAVEAETGGDAATLTWTLVTGTSATALSSTQTSTSDILNSACMTAVSATTADNAGKDGLTVKLNVGTADAAAATVTFTVPAGFAFIPHKTTAKVQPISKDAYVKLDVNGTATEATSFTQGTITTAALTESTERMLTGTVTIGIYVYDGASTGVTTYRLGSPITISGELVATVSTLANRNYGTYVTGCGLDFTDVTDAMAFIATGFTSSKDAIVLQQVNKVAANTPLIIYTAEKTDAVTVRVPITKDDADAAVADNALVAGDGTTAWDGTSGYTYYYIASDQFHKATSGTLQSGKAYLKVADEDVPAGSRSFGFVFADDSTTGVVSMDNGQWIMDNEAAAVYDLQGRKVNVQSSMFNLQSSMFNVQLKKGLYIVNGRKVIIK